MASTIDLYRLLGTYRSERERDPAEPPLDTAARVVAWAGDRLDRVDAGSLVMSGRSALAGRGSLHGLGLSPRTVTLIERLEEANVAVRYYRSQVIAGVMWTAYQLPESDLPVLLAAGLVEWGRDLSPREALRADLATCRRSLRDLTRAEYDEWNVDWLPDEFGLSPGPLMFFGGWIPIGIVAIVAGIVVGFISGDWWLALGTAIGGTIFGYVAAIVAVITYVVLDNRWLRLGQQVNAAYVVFLSVGSAVALLVATLVLLNA